jgi:hypothetical protein
LELAGGIFNYLFIIRYPTSVLVFSLMMTITINVIYLKGPYIIEAASITFGTKVL